tara:strand:+ start:417 stop:563 length:147 start_codon:yes stop_codon:yes gene_type:complete
MAKQKTIGTVTFTPTIKGTSQGRKPITSTMNKHKRRMTKNYRGQGKSR